jgi:FkbM family methyltransferase
VARGDCVLDVGANTGYYTRLFSRLVGSAGMVAAFEPVPATFGELRDRVLRDRLDNVRLFEAAVSFTTGTVTIVVPGRDGGQASRAEHSSGSWSNSERTRHTCRAVTLDQVTSERDLGEPTIIKCDVEGGEMDVLRGAGDLLRRCQPILHLEVSDLWSHAFGYRASDLVRHLRALGYSEFFVLDDRVDLLDEPERDIDSRIAGVSANLLCLAMPRHAGRLERLFAHGGP